MNYGIQEPEWKVYESRTVRGRQVGVRLQGRQCSRVSLSLEGFVKGPG